MRGGLSVLDYVRVIAVLRKCLAKGFAESRQRRMAIAEDREFARTRRIVAREVLLCLRPASR